MNPDSLDELGLQSRRLRTQRLQVLTREGDASVCVLLIESGEYRLSKLSSLYDPVSGQPLELTLAQLGKGEEVGTYPLAAVAMAHIAHCKAEMERGAKPSTATFPPHPLTVTCSSPGVVFSIPVQPLFALLISRPSLLRHLTTDVLVHHAVHLRRFEGAERYKREQAQQGGEGYIEALFEREQLRDAHQPQGHRLRRRTRRERRLQPAGLQWEGELKEGDDADARDVERKMKEERRRLKREVREARQERRRRREQTGVDGDGRTLDQVRLANRAQLQWQAGQAAQQSDDEQHRTQWLVEGQLSQQLRSADEEEAGRVDAAMAAWLEQRNRSLAKRHHSQQPIIDTPQTKAQPQEGSRGEQQPEGKQAEAALSSTTSAIRQHLHATSRMRARQAGEREGEVLVAFPAVESALPPPSQVDSFSPRGGSGLPAVSRASLALGTLALIHAVAKEHQLTHIVHPKALARLRGSKEERLSVQRVVDWTDAGKQERPHAVQADASELEEEEERSRRSSSAYYHHRRSRSHSRRNSLLQRDRDERREQRSSAAVDDAIAEEAEPTTASEDDQANGERDGVPGSYDPLRHLSLVYSPVVLQPFSPTLRDGSINPQLIQSIESGADVFRLEDISGQPYSQRASLTHPSADLYGRHEQSEASDALGEEADVLSSALPGASAGQVQDGEDWAAAWSRRGTALSLMGSRSVAGSVDQDSESVFRQMRERRQTALQAAATKGARALSSAGGRLTLSNRRQSLFVTEEPHAGGAQSDAAASLLMEDPLALAALLTDQSTTEKLMGPSASHQHLQATIAAGQAQREEERKAGMGEVKSARELLDELYGRSGLTGLTEVMDLMVREKIGADGQAALDHAMLTGGLLSLKLQQRLSAAVDVVVAEMARVEQLREEWRKAVDAEKDSRHEEREQRAARITGQQLDDEQQRSAELLQSQQLSAAADMQQQASDSMPPTSPSFPSPTVAAQRAHRAAAAARLSSAAEGASRVLMAKVKAVDEGEAETEESGWSSEEEELTNEEEAPVAAVPRPVLLATPMQVLSARSTSGAAQKATSPSQSTVLSPQTDSTGDAALLSPTPRPTPPSPLSAPPAPGPAPQLAADKSSPPAHTASNASSAVEAAAAVAAPPLIRPSTPLLVNLSATLLSPHTETMSSSAAPNAEGEASSVHLLQMDSEEEVEVMEGGTEVKATPTALDVQSGLVGQRASLQPRLSPRPLLAVPSTSTRSSRSSTPVSLSPAHVLPRRAKEEAVVEAEEALAAVKPVAPAAQLALSFGKAQSSFSVPTPQPATEPIAPPTEVDKQSTTEEAVKKSGVRKKGRAVRGKEDSAQALRSERVGKAEAKAQAERERQRLLTEAEERAEAEREDSVEAEAAAKPHQASPKSLHELQHTQPQAQETSEAEQQSPQESAASTAEEEHSEHAKKGKRRPSHVKQSDEVHADTSEKKKQPTAAATGKKAATRPRPSAPPVAPSQTPARRRSSAASSSAQEDAAASAPPLDHGSLADDTESQSEEESDEEGATAGKQRRWSALEAAELRQTVVAELEHLFGDEVRHQLLLKAMTRAGEVVEAKKKERRRSVLEQRRAEQRRQSQNSPPSTAGASADVLSLADDDEEAIRAAALQQVAELEERRRVEEEQRRLQAERRAREDERLHEEKRLHKEARQRHKEEKAKRKKAKQLQQQSMEEAKQSFTAAEQQEQSTTRTPSHSRIAELGSAESDAAQLSSPAHHKLSTPAQGNTARPAHTARTARTPRRPHADNGIDEADEEPTTAAEDTDATGAFAPVDQHAGDPRRRGGRRGRRRREGSRRRRRRESDEEDDAPHAGAGDEDLYYPDEVGSSDPLMQRLCADSDWSAFNPSSGTFTSSPAAPVDADGFDCTALIKDELNRYADLLTADSSGGLLPKTWFTFHFLTGQALLLRQLRAHRQGGADSPSSSSSLLSVFEFEETVEGRAARLAAALKAAEAAKDALEDGEIKAAILRRGSLQAYETRHKEVDGRRSVQMARRQKEREEREQREARERQLALQSSLHRSRLDVEEAEALAASREQQRLREQLHSPTMCVDVRVEEKTQSSLDVEQASLLQSAQGRLQLSSLAYAERDRREEAEDEQSSRDMEQQITATLDQVDRQRKERAGLPSATPPSSSSSFLPSLAQPSSGAERASASRRAAASPSSAAPRAAASVGASLLLSPSAASPNPLLASRTATAAYAERRVSASSMLRDMGRLDGREGSRAAGTGALLACLPNTTRAIPAAQMPFAKDARASRTTSYAT